MELRVIKMEILCPVCGKGFSSYLNLARHMVSKDRPIGNRPAGEHIEYLEMVIGRPFTEFGWGKDKQIGIALKRYLNRS